MPRAHSDPGQEPVAPATAGRVPLVDPRTRVAINAVIDSVEPHLAALGVTGTGLITLARATGHLADSVDRGFAQINQNFDRMDERFDRMDERFDRMEARFGVVEDDIRRLSANMERLIGYVIRDELSGNAPTTPKPRPKRQPPTQR